eukprot:CAMPEP_0206234066 /NCGR_PEP_ID=MMETSP0047_2-20121206/12369_1 /ASSEMBLY_ACC=CAM_ASM_000192 /TAXON_ID=195065 /ORGANISM="Chroomonas mesostigmatica_cf, Strain CCMP1168" /LENGTH=267 /DNA_ID=CAMNT_0053658081 /DNA_START=14 /DNA_END=817 /DNA_ORIENTATION=-
MRSLCLLLLATVATAFHPGGMPLRLPGSAGPGRLLRAMGHARGGAVCRQVGGRMAVADDQAKGKSQGVSFTPSGETGRGLSLVGMEENLLAKREEEEVLDEKVIDSDISEGKAELQNLKTLTDEEAEKLRERLSKEIDRAMLQEQAKMLEVYDAKTQQILENMKKERDIIRQEAENLKRLTEEVEGGKFWKGKSKKKTNATLTIATVLAYTFAFASVNELYKGLTSDEGLTFIGGLKGVVDALLAVASTYIANKGPQKQLDEENDSK